MLLLVTLHRALMLRLLSLLFIMGVAVVDIRVVGAIIGFVVIYRGLLDVLLC